MLRDHLTSSPDKTCYVNMNERRHQILTVKTIHYSTMTRNGVRKVLQNKKAQAHSVTVTQSR